MNSKEALEKILNSPTPKMRGGSYLDIKIIESIKQDLDRLEKLEKVIDYLKDNFNLKISKSYNEDGTLKYILFSDRIALKYGLIVRKENIELLKEVLGNDK